MSNIVNATSWNNLCGFASMSSAIISRIYNAKGQLPKEYQQFLNDLSIHLGIKQLSANDFSTLYNVYGEDQMQKICAPVIRATLAKKLTASLSHDPDTKIMAQLDPMLDYLRGGARDDELASSCMMLGAPGLQLINIATRLAKFEQQNPNHPQLRQHKINLLKSYYSEIGKLNNYNYYMATANDLGILADHFHFNISIYSHNNYSNPMYSQSFDRKNPELILHNHSKAHWTRQKRKSEVIQPGSGASSAISNMIRFATKSSALEVGKEASLVLKNKEARASILTSNSVFMEANRSINTYLDNHLNNKGEVNQEAFEKAFEEQVRQYQRSQLIGRHDDSQEHSKPSVRKKHFR